MHQRIIGVALLVTGALANPDCAFAEDPSVPQRSVKSNFSERDAAIEFDKLKPPEIRLAGIAHSEEQKMQYSLTFEFSNPNTRALSYVGYSPDSFNPPLEKGLLVYGVKFKRDGKWHRYPQGLCGTGLAYLVLAPKSQELFGVAFDENLAPHWEAVKVGISWAPREIQGRKVASLREITKPARAWSKEITRKEIEKHK